MIYQFTIVITRNKNMRETGLARYQNYLKLLRATIEQREDVKLYLELLLTLFAISFFALFAIRPTLSTIIILTKQISTQEEVATKLDQKIANLKAASAQKERFERNLLTINQSIPDDEAASLAARQLETLAIKENVNLLDMSLTSEVSPANNKNDSKNLLVSLSASGEPQRIIEFISQTGNMRRPILWETLTVSGKPTGAATTLDASFTGKVPFLPQ